MRSDSKVRGDYYARLLNSPKYKESRKEKADVVLHVVGEQLKKAGWVADIGAGTGIMKKELEIKIGKSIIGIEIDRSTILDNDRMIVADGCQLPVRTGQIDVALLNHVYEHTNDATALFAETWRVLQPGGIAYVSAGSRWAVMEPHYRLPFLSWIPRKVAHIYLRLTRRGESYEGIHFLGRQSLVEIMTRAGFQVRDVTEFVLEGLRGPLHGKGWGLLWSTLRHLPGMIRRLILKGSPQWFFLLEREKDGTMDH